MVPRYDAVLDRFFIVCLFFGFTNARHHTHVEYDCTKLLHKSDTIFLWTAMVVQVDRRQIIARERQPTSIGPRIHFSSEIEADSTYYLSPSKERSGFHKIEIRRRESRYLPVFQQDIENKKTSSHSGL